MRFREFIRESQELDEVKMSPGALRQWASSPAAQGMLMGIEFEMVVADLVLLGYGEDVPDFSRDTYVSDINEIVDFFSEANYPARVRSDLNARYQDWVYENIDNELVVDDARENLLGDFDFGPAMEKARKELGDDADEDAVESLAYDIVNDTISEMYASGSAEWDEAYEEAEAEHIKRLSERDWLISEGVRTALEAFEEFDLEWPYYEPGELEDDNLDDLGVEVSQVVGAKVNTSGSYHGGKREKGAWVIETDSSIDPHSDRDSGVEIVSPAEPIAKTLDSMNKLWSWANKGGCYTNDSTGLHMNISVPNFSVERLDYIKLALFMGDKHVLQQFDRVGNRYCRSATAKIEAGITDNNTLQLLNAMKKGMNAAASKIIHSGSTDKYTSINTREGWVEFRGPGGDYLSKSPEELASTALRLAMALSIACDDNAYKNEYNKKLYKLLAPTSGTPDTVNLFSRYASGELSQGELKSFVRKIQGERKPEEPSENSILYTLENLSTGKTFPVVARSPEDALSKASYTINVPVDQLRVISQRPAG